MRALVVDDEPLARKRLRRLLEPHRDVEIVGEAGDGQAALQAMSDLEPDLLFLDIQMPGMNGFEVLAALHKRPAVIFVTAHDEFAVRAFEEQALDYLLKPVEPERLERALARLRATDAAPSTRDDRLDRLLQALDRTRPASDRIVAKLGARVTLIEPSSIVYCRAQDKYTIVRTHDAEHIVDRSIDDLERTLDPSAFMRIHRSTLVNLTCVKDLTAVEGARFVVTLTDRQGTKLHASRAGAKMLRERFKI